MYSLCLFMRLEKTVLEDMFFSWHRQFRFSWNFKFSRKSPGRFQEASRMTSECPEAPESVQAWIREGGKGRENVTNVKVFSSVSWYFMVFRVISLFCHECGAIKVSRGVTDRTAKTRSTILERSQLQVSKEASFFERCTCAFVLWKEGGSVNSEFHKFGWILL